MSVDSFRVPDVSTGSYLSARFYLVLVQETWVKFEWTYMTDQITESVASTCKVEDECAALNLRYKAHIILFIMPPI